MIKHNKWVQPITLFLTAQTISLLGSSIVQYAIIWYITLSTSSGKMLTISTICGFLPQVLISLFAGVWVDRYNRKYLVMLSDSIIAISTLLLCIAFISGYQSIGLLCVVLMIRSAGTGIQTPAVNSIIPQLVSQEDLMKTNGINNTLSSMILFISPAISGAILSIASLEATLLIDVLTAVIGVGITSRIALQHHARTGKQNNTYVMEIKQGFAYLKEHRNIKRLLIYQIIILFLISPSAFLTPLLVSRTFGPEVFRLTMSEMTYSFGMILGGLFITTKGGYKNKLHTMMFAGGLYGVLMIGIGCSPIFIIYLLCNTCIGLTSPCYNTPLTVTIQEKTPAQMHGRIFSLMQIASSCALPFGMVLFGPLADYIDTQIILIIAGTCVLLISCFVFFTKFFEQDRIS